MNEKEAILEFLTDELSGTPYFLVGLRTGSNLSKISIYIDGDEGLDVEYCQELSYKLGDYLEENDIMGETAYILEVSSPGADQPFKYIRQYIKHVGRGFELVMMDGTTFEGNLISVEEGQLSFHAIDRNVRKDQKPKVSTETTVIDYHNIKEGKIILEF